MVQQRRQAKGFSLLELMLVVGMIGVIATIAIPIFQTHQMRSKRSEAYSNLAAIARTQKAFFAEYSTYVGVASQPGPGGGSLSPAKRDWTAANTTAFGTLGWKPEGNVFYDYDSNSSALGVNGCSCQGCFTSAAYSDLDGDNSVSAFMFIHPDANGNWCQSTALALADPLQDSGGIAIFDTVARHQDTDDY